MSQLPVPLNKFDIYQELFDNLGAVDTNHEPASLPVPNSTHSFWLHPSKTVNPLAKEGSNGPLTNDVDLCIVGSGISGVSAAYHISKMCKTPIKIAILEARDFCSGATGSYKFVVRFSDKCISLGQDSHLKEMGETEALKQFRLERHSVDEILSIIKNNGLEDIVDLVSGGHIDLMFTDQELETAQEDFRLARDAGADLTETEWFTTEEMEKIYGTKYAAVKIPGHNLWPLKLVTQIFKLAKSKLGSLRLHTNTPVTSITSSTIDNRRWELHTPRGSISCRSVLHATNGYASHLLPFLAGPSGIIPVRGQIIATRAEVSLDELSISSWSGNEGFEYWFPRPLKDPDNKSSKPLVILGGGREVEEYFELNETDDSVLNDKASEILRRFLPAVFPEKYKENEEPEVEWTGIMGFTSLRDPFVGPVIDKSGKELEGQYIAAGYSGHGMPRTYACAEAVASLILHDLESLPREKWSPPTWLPSRYLTWNRMLTPRNHRQ